MLWMKHQPSNSDRIVGRIYADATSSAFVRHVDALRMLVSVALSTAVESEPVLIATHQCTTSSQPSTSTSILVPAKMPSQVAHTISVVF
jgi:hypothetical protein